MTDWGYYRKLYPVTHQQTYFMTAGAGAISTPVLNAILARYHLVSQKGGMVFGDNLQLVETCREKIAKLINADKNHIAFIPSVSFGMNAIAQSLIVSPENRFLIAEDDFPATVLPWKNTKHNLHFVPSAMELYTHNEEITHIVSSYIHFAHGYRVNIEDMKHINPQVNVIINGTQAIGAFPIDVQKQKIDALVCGCYKWLGCGEGLTFMYIHPRLFAQMHPTFVGWRSVESAMSFNGETQFYPSARVFELGWDNMTIFSGFNAALDLVFEIGVDQIRTRIEELAEYLIGRLQDLEIPIASNTNSEVRSGIVLIGPFEKLTLDSLVADLEANSIYTTQRNQGLRISLHYYNNKDDIDNLLTIFS